MAIPPSLKNLTGNWTADYRLRLPAPEAPQESASAASVTLVANARFLRIDYSWAYGSEPQEGSILIGCDSKDSSARAVWIDSWHMCDAFMVCTGAITTAGSLDLRGSYPAPPGPDWGWRTIIAPLSRDSFRLTMWNITPDGREELAVEAEYSRT